jgi:hypothetical protein
MRHKDRDGRRNEESANTSTSGREISIGSVSHSNANVNSGSMAFGSGESDFVTVASSGNAHQQAESIAVASSSIQRRAIMPRRSKRVPKGLCDQVTINPDSSAGIRTKDMDNNTETGVTRKRNAEDSSLKSRKKGSFEGRYKQLIDFIDEFEYCNVSRKSLADPSSGQWCSTLRCAYNQIQQGQTPRSNLTQDQIERLEEIGFKWNLALQGMTTVEQRCHDLEAFKSEFGHCNVSRKYSANPSLGQWCSRMRCYYNQIQQGRTPERNLTQDKIERLEDIGFKWKVEKVFVQRWHDFEAFKSEFGHCNVSVSTL